MSRIQVFFSVPSPLHFEIHFAGPPKSGINMCSSSPKAYLSEVRVGWHFLVRFISCNDVVFLVLLSSTCFERANLDKANKQIRYTFINTIFRNKFLRFNIP